MGKKLLFVLFVLAIGCFLNEANAQCSICTKTVQQMGEKPAAGLNAGILYLMTTPLALIGFIGYRYWKSTQK